MKEDDKLLQIITNETKNSIEDLDIVTPTMYASLFSKHASKNDTILDNEEDIVDHFLDEKMSQFTDMQNQTSENVQKLSDNTDKALNAIKDKDEAVLNEVLKEAQSLRVEIEKLKKSVYKDALTHVYNRKWLYDNLLDAQGQCFKNSGTLAIIDINYFKIINDTYGHILGDKVLIFIANELKKIKENVVRYGGDEFIVIFCNGVTQKTAISKLNILREALLTKHLKAKDVSFKVSFSLGAQEFKKGDILNEIIEKADKNMYLDKIEIKKKIPGI